MSIGSWQSENDEDCNFFEKLVYIQKNLIRVLLAQNELWQFEEQLGKKTKKILLFSWPINQNIGDEDE